MTSFAKLQGYKTYYKLEKHTFHKYYYEISDDHWDRITNTVKILSDNGICPKLLSIYDGDDFRCITYERVTPFDNYIIPKDMNMEYILSDISDLVNKMHSIGYGHGDLTLSSVGHKDGRIYLLDNDTNYLIEDGPVPWLLLWMEEGPISWLLLWMEEDFNWDDTFEQFIQNDYTFYYNGWIC